MVLVTALFCCCTSCPGVLVVPLQQVLANELIRWPDHQCTGDLALLILPGSFKRAQERARDTCLDFAGFFFVWRFIGCIAIKANVPHYYSSIYHIDNLISCIVIEQMCCLQQKSQAFSTPNGWLCFHWLANKKKALIPKNKEKCLKKMSEKTTNVSYPLASTTICYVLSKQPKCCVKCLCTVLSGCLQPCDSLPPSAAQLHAWWCGQARLGALESPMD